MKIPSTKAIITGVGLLGSFASIVALVGPSSSAPAPSEEPARLEVPPLSNLLFSEARELLLREGWFPVSSPVNPTANQALLSGNGPYFVDKGYREVISCSGTGLAPCKFAYRSEAGQYLYLVTVGEDEHARVNDLWVTDGPDD